MLSIVSDMATVQEGPAFISQGSIHVDVQVADTRQQGSSLLDQVMKASKEELRQLLPMAPQQDAQKGNATIEQPMKHSFECTGGTAKQQKPNMLDQMVKAFQEEPPVQITGADCEGPGYP